MAYEIRVTDRAERDLEAIYLGIRAEESLVANRWFVGLRRAILTLGEMPNRNPRIPESLALRHLLYGRKPHVYRVIYRVSERRAVVEILHIRHGAMDAVRAGDL